MYALGPFLDPLTVPYMCKMQLRLTIFKSLKLMTQSSTNSELLPGTQFFQRIRKQTMRMVNR